jgi:hypothetical protein
MTSVKISYSDDSVTVINSPMADWKSDHERFDFLETIRRGWKSAVFTNLNKNTTSILFNQPRQIVKPVKK